MTPEAQRVYQAEALVEGLRTLFAQYPPAQPSRLSETPQHWRRSALRAAKDWDLRAAISRAMNTGVPNELLLALFMMVATDEDDQEDISDVFHTHNNPYKDFWETHWGTPAP